MMGIRGVRDSCPRHESFGKGQGPYNDLTWSKQMSRTPCRLAESPKEKNPASLLQNGSILGSRMLLCSIHPSFSVSVPSVEFYLGKAAIKADLGLYLEKSLAQKTFKKNFKLWDGKIHHKRSQNTNCRKKICIKVIPLM